MRAVVALVLSLPGAALAQTTNVLWYHGNDGANAGSAGFAASISDLGGELVLHDEWSAVGSLSDYRFVVIARPTTTFTAPQIADLNAFVDDYGVLILLGDSELGASQAGIETMNGLTSGLGLEMSLLPESHFNPDGECLPGSTTNLTPFLDVAAPLHLVDVGDIHVGGAAEIVETFSIFVPQQGTLSFTMMARQGLVLLTADYQSFTADTCGIAAKEAMWDNVWRLYCDRDQDQVASVECGGLDCDDTDPSVLGSADYYDLDGDGHGDPNAAAPCMPGTVRTATDCDDTDPLVNPDQMEVCDGIDNDCDNDVDIDANDAMDWYLDFDGDGFGREGEVVSACEQPDHHVAAANDCDDGREEINPEAQEQCSNNLDDDCDGEIDEGCVTTRRVPPPTKPCSVGGVHLLGVPLWLAVGLIRRRERR